MFVAILNHKLNDETVRMVEGFRPYAEVFAIDSGSEPEPRHYPYFGRMLPNVHYSGMVNAACEALRDGSDQTLVYLITSDVRIDAYDRLIALTKEAFQDPRVGVYAPSVVPGGSIHQQMIHRSAGGLRRVVWTDGFCFAMRATVLRRIYPIDTSLNRIGWGIDLYLSYMARRLGMDAVVDDRVIVGHTPGPNHPDPVRYDADARRQFNAWFESLSPAARRFRRIALCRPLKGRFGAFLVRQIPWPGPV